MVDPPTPPVSTPSSRNKRRDGGRHNKRNHRPRNNVHHNNNRQQQRVIQHQTQKITFRGFLHHPASVKDICDSIRDTILTANTTLVTKIVLDEASVQKLVQTEQLIKEAEKANEKNTESTTPNMEADNVAVKDEERPKTAAEIVKGNLPVDATPINSISARVLYIIPPHLSKRRGLKPGYAHVILQAPAAHPTSLPLSGNEPPPPAFKAKLVAIGRLQLALALESLSKVNPKVEASLSGKSWKDKDSHRDRREGTITTTGDYIKFVEQEELRMASIQARSKPAPGGGVLSSIDGEQDKSLVSAIVLHLRAKRAEQKTKQMAKKKSKKDITPTTTGSNRSKGENTKVAANNKSSTSQQQQQNAKSNRKPKPQQQQQQQQRSKKRLGP